MSTQTTLDLVASYRTLADTHRKAAVEHGPHSGLRALHLLQAETAEVHAIAWQQRADKQFHVIPREVDHA